MSINLGNTYPSPVAGVSGQSLTVSSAATSFATSFSVNAQLVLIDVQGADCFVTFGGETPSTTQGHRLYAGQNYTWSRQTAIQAKFIRAATDATLYATNFQM